MSLLSSLRVRLLRSTGHFHASRNFRISTTCSGQTTKRAEPGLLIHNSLTRSKVPLAEPNGEPLKWYSCGPTVYDSPHLGHARNYVAQDIIRRVLVEHFGYDIHFVMNVTDIDDKIIARTRERYFLETFSSSHPRLSPTLLSEIEECLRLFVSTRIPIVLPQGFEGESTGPESWPALLEKLNRTGENRAALRENELLQGYVLASTRCLEALILAQSQLDSGQVNTASNDAVQLILQSRDILGPILNEKNRHESIDDSLFARTAHFWELQFFHDMARLNVLPPDTVTRASEYVSEIVAFVNGIMDKGYAYVRSGSVYFDTDKFSKSGDHEYNKFIGATKSRRDEEGAAASTFGSDKKSTADFALWKAVKPGEPSWPSPWGIGRPGWHIECSAMASSIFGSHMHIHSGGVDLMFPHHTNELAQSEAYHTCDNWVDCFIHVGHLHIDGHKMSKSLKNFITIEDLLKKYTARQIRLAFLLRAWDSRLDYSESIMTQEVVPLEASINNFFSHISSLSLDGVNFKNHCTFGIRERQLREEFDRGKADFHKALSDSINTPAAISAIKALISQTNIYLNQSPGGVDGFLVLGIGRWITRMLKMFGLDADDSSHVGWGARALETDGTTRKAELLPYLRVLSSFRDGIRRIAQENSASTRTQVLALCDSLRDTVLPSMGIQLADRPDGVARVKLVETPKSGGPISTQLSAQNDHQDLVAKSKVAHARRLERSKVNAFDMFKPPHCIGQYSSWDTLGLPLTDSDGKELSKNRRKKLQKAWNLQKALHEEYEKSQ